MAGRRERLMTGMFPWHGGECPEHPDSRIYPEYRGPVDPAKGVRITCAPASRLDWSHDGGPDDIIAYRIGYDARLQP